MHRIGLRTAAVIVLCFCQTAFRYPGTLDLEKGTNVILIVIDTLRPDRLGAYGHRRKTSPRLDALARQSILFKNVVAQSSWTPPGTASILTGLYPKHHQVNLLTTGLSEEKVLLSEILKGAGYRTYAFVANSLAGDIMGFNQGFDFFKVYFEEDQKLGKYYYSDEVNADLLPFVAQMPHADYNFLYVHYADPHFPYLPRERHFSKNNKIVDIRIPSGKLVFQKAIFTMKPAERRRIMQEMLNAYDDEILFNDKSLGRLLDALKARGLYERSLIIVTSDHGEAFGEHGNMEHRRSLYDEEILIPLLIKMPDGYPLIVEEQASQVDILPSVLGLLGLDYDHHLDGRNLFDSQKQKEFEFIELSFTTSRVTALRSLAEKMIVRKSARDPEYRWYQDSVEIPFNGTEFEAVIAAVRKPRSMDVLVNGEFRRKVEITAKATSIRLKFDDQRHRSIRLQITSPCEVVRNKRRGKKTKYQCLSFRLFSQSNFDIRYLDGARPMSKAYFSYGIAGERNNLYALGRHRQEADRLVQRIEEFEQDIRISNAGPSDVNFDPRQLEILRSLGYIQ